jgi:carboxylesterase
MDKLSISQTNSYSPDIPHGEQPCIGVLLVHGLNADTSDYAELATLLEAAGYITENVLLPGHGPGTHSRKKPATGWLEWASTVRSALQALKQRCDRVFLVGHSLGGALCLHVAAHEPVTGIVVMCAPLYLQPWMLFAVSLAKHITPSVPSLREDVRDPHARWRYPRGEYRWTPMLPVESMLRYLPHLRTELPTITAPALVMHAQHDHVVPAHDGREIYRLLGSPEKYLVTFHRSYHVIMKDYEREEVFARTRTFIQQVASACDIVEP